MSTHFVAVTEMSQWLTPTVVGVITALEGLLLGHWTSRYMASSEIEWGVQAKRGMHRLIVSLSDERRRDGTLTVIGRTANLGIVLLFPFMVAAVGVVVSLMLAIATIAALPFMAAMATEYVWAWSTGSESPSLISPLGALWEDIPRGGPTDTGWPDAKAWVCILVISFAVGCTVSMIVRSLKRRSDAIVSDAARLKEDGTPTPWGEAVAHAEKLREQGVRVKIGNMGPMSIAIRDDNGLLHDPDDGTPAIQDFYPDGTPKQISHWTDGYRHDPADGTPASCGFYPDGTPEWIDHYTNGKRHDPADGTPASCGFYPDGTPEWISHWTNGERHDPADGTPARQGFYPSGTTEWISHYTNGRLHDPADGTPAVQKFYLDGTPRQTSHYRRGFLDDPADGAPAYKEFYRDGSPSVVVYYSDGRLLHTESVY